MIKYLEIKVSELISKTAAEKNTKAMRLQIVQAESFKNIISSKNETVKVLNNAIEKLSEEIKSCH